MTCASRFRRKVNYSKCPILIFTAAVVVLFSGCSSPTATHPSSPNGLVGLWAGEIRELPAVAYTRWIADRRPDGTYSITFRNFSGDGSYYDNVETGTWHSHDALYYTITLTQHSIGRAPRRNVHFEESYRIISLTESDFTYQDMKSGTVFSVRRVPEGYVLPEE